MREKVIRTREKTIWDRSEDVEFCIADGNLRAVRCSFLWHLGAQLDVVF